MSSLRMESKGNTLVIYFTETRILEESKIRHVGDELIKLLNKTNEEHLLLDFRGVDFMSSAMLGTLIRFNKKCKEFKVKLKLCEISPGIREVFKITRLEKVFDIYASQAEAAAAFSKRSFFS